MLMSRKKPAVQSVLQSPVVESLAVPILVAAQMLGGTVRSVRGLLWAKNSLTSSWVRNLSFPLTLYVRSCGEQHETRSTWRGGTRSVERLKAAPRQTQRQVPSILYSSAASAHSWISAGVKNCILSVVGQFEFSRCFQWSRYCSARVEKSASDYTRSSSAT